MADRIMILVVLLLAISIRVNAYTVIIPSTAAPSGTEQALIAQTTTYFNATVFTNPLFPGTYQISLNGSAVSDFQILKDSGTYGFVYGQGILDERSRDIGNMSGPDVNCDATPYCSSPILIAPGNFKTYDSTYTVTIDTATCQAIVCRIAGDIYSQNYSPQPIP